MEDPYRVLGVSRMHQKMKSKKRTGVWQRSIIPI